MEPPAFPRTGIHTTRAAPGSEANIILPLPSGTPPFAYEWTRAGATLDGRFKNSVEAGGIRLTVTAAQTGDSGVYTLQASNAAGKDSTRVSLEVSPDEIPTGDDPPAFLRRLQDLTVKVGTRTRFLVEIISSTECKVTWYRNERRLLEADRIALVRDGNFWCADVATVSVDDAGRWTCTAENLGGRASCSAHLNVLVPKAYKRPEFVEELRAILTEQGTVSLECKVVGVPTPVLRWFKDSREIKAGDVFALTANADDPTSLGTYTCEAINCMGRAYSSSKVHVIGRSKESFDRLSSSGITPDPPPIFTKEIEDQFVRICDSLTLNCHIVVPPWPRSVVWYNKEGKIEPSTKYHVLEDGVGGYMVEVSRAEWADEGEWKCVATSAGGRVGISTCSVTMDVPKNYRKPRFMENLQAVLTEEGLVSFECKVVGFPTPVLSWFKDGQELKPGDVYQLTGTNSLGSYCCIARNCMGQASSSAELTVEDIQNQLNEEEKLQLFSKNQAPKFLQGLKSVEVKIDEPFRFTIKVAIPPDPTVLWYRDDQPVDDSTRCHLGREDRGVFYLDIKNLELMDQTEWKCVAMNDFGHSVTSCFLKLIIPRHFKKPRFLENLQAILSDEGAVNLECKVIGVPQPVLKWYKDGEELKPGDIHRIISGQDGTCCLGTYTCEAQNCMGIAASSASLLGFEDTVKAKKKKAEEQTLQRNLSLSTIHEERTSQMYDTPVADVTLDDKGEISFSFDGKEVSVSLYETPDLTEEEALQIVEMYADQLSENVTEHNVIELPPLRFVKETSTSGNLLMEALIIDVSPDYFASPEEDLRTEADIEDISIADENIHAQLSFDQEVGEDYIEKTMALLSDEKADVPSKVPRRKSDSQKSGEDYFSLSKDLSLSEEKKDDDTQILSESVSFASARSTGKQKSKPSQEDELGTQESSDITKTVLLREERRASIDMDKRVKYNIENSSNQDSKDINIEAVELPIDSLIIETLNQDMLFISTLLFKVINDIQVMERDIILKSQLMSSAAIASKSLEIINSLITPLSEIHSIANTVRETVNESSEIRTKLFSKLPFNLKELQKSLIMVEKCIDVGSDKTLIKNTCISIINNCEEDITNVVTKIKNVTVSDLSFIDNTVISQVQSLTRDILNIIQISRSTVAAKSILNQEIKKDEVSVDIQHLNDTLKAIYDLKIPLHSLLSIVENALKENTVSSININSAEVILINMSASIQDLQTALEHIEFLSVEESNSSLQKYNTNVIETVMGSVLKLRSSFENLSMEKKHREDTENLQNVLQVIKINLSEISSHIDTIESTIGVFDVLHGDNKLEILQKMAHILISLENSLPILNTLRNVQSTLTTFHKNLTKALEHVIECNDSTKYLTLVRICDVINRINVSIKSISSSKLLSLASIGNNFSIIEEILKNNSIDQDLHQDILKSINQYFIDIQNIMIYIEDESIRIDSEPVYDIPIDLYYNESKANTVIHQIDQVIAVINNVPSEEVISNLSAVVPVLQNICPVLEELKYNVASLKQTTQENESQSSDISVSSLAQSFGKPLRELHENITVLNQLILESVGEEKFKDELTAVFAKPLHELYTTLQTLQENIISQYDSISSMHASGKVATAAQILQNCILLVQEQLKIEPIEEMSTLDDISCIKTTADSISSDHLMLPLVEVTTVEQAPTFFRIEDQQPKVAYLFQLLHNDIMEIQKLDIIDALNTLSKVKEYADLKLASESIEELQNKITGILSPLLMESLSSVSNLDMARSNVTTVSETLLKLKNHLSIIDVNNIPTYENVLPSDKIHLIVKNISNLKLHLDQCLSAVDQSANAVPEFSKEIDTLYKVCKDFKTCIRDHMQNEVKTRLSLDSICVLENSIDFFLKAMDTSHENVEIIKGECEKFYKEILRLQDDVVQYVSLPGDVYLEDDQFVAKINIIANNVPLLEQHNIIDISNTLDMYDFIKPMYNITSEAKSFIVMEDLVKSKVTVINDLIQQTHSSDLVQVLEFFNSCKSSFFVMRTLICQQPTRKKLIRLLHEYFKLQMRISDFLNQQSRLDLSPEVQLCLDDFFIQAGSNLEKIKASMLRIYASLSTSLFKIPLEKMKGSIEYLPKYLKLDSMLDLHGLIQNYLIILNIAYPHLKNLENAVNNELQSCVFIDSYVEDRLITESLDNFITFLENEINTSTERKVLLTDIVKCFQNHQDYKNALGTSKKMIILKCLDDCSDLLWKHILETEKKVELVIEHKSLQTLLNKLVEPLKLINGEIKKIQIDDLYGFVQSIQLKAIEAYAENIVQINKVIQEYVDFEEIQFHEDDNSLAKAVIQEIHSIQENLRTVKNVKEFHLSVTETCLKELEIFLNKTLLIGKASSERKLSQSLIESFLQHVEQYIEITETIEEISAIVNLQNIQEVKSIMQEMREGIANSEIKPDDALEKEVTENQNNLVQRLQKTLANIHDQGLTMTKTADFISSDTSVQQHVIEIINHLKDDLNTIASVEIPKNYTIVKCTTNDSEFISNENLQSIEIISPEPIKLNEQYDGTGSESNVIDLQHETVKNIETDINSDKTKPFSDGDNPNLIIATKIDVNDKPKNRSDLQTYTEKIDDIELVSRDLECNEYISQSIDIDAKMYIEECKDQEVSTDIHKKEANAVEVIHQIENTILSISNIYVEESPSNMNNIYPVLENICPVLEELKFNFASLQQTEQGIESYTSDMSDQSVEHTFGKPLRKLEENISVLNQLLLESVKNNVENEQLPEVFAKPLHELYCTYQILQENVISQLESFSSLHDSINIAETTQILQNCVLLVEEQHLIEAADEISTLEDVSCIKTTAESISSDGLLIAQETHITKKDYNDEEENTFTNIGEYEIGPDYSNKIEILDNIINKQASTEGLLETVEVQGYASQIPLISENEKILDKGSPEKEDIIIETIATEQYITTNKELCSKNMKIPIEECKTVVEENALEDDRNIVELIIINEELNYNYKEVVEPATEKNIEKDSASLGAIQSIQEYDKNCNLQSDLTDLKTTTVEPKRITSQNVEPSMEDTMYDVFEEQANISYSSPITLEIIDEKCLKHEEVTNKMESLMMELQENIKFADINISHNTEVIQNILDEFQMQIIKLKSVNIKETSETLDDLECSVRSVQLLVSESSPPHHVVEASETLQLLINSLKDELNTTNFDIVAKENDHNLLEKCVEDTETTLLLLNKASETKANREDIDKIITELNSVKDTIKSIKQNFATDEENLIENGVDIIQTIDMIENQLFSIESDVDKILNVDLITRDTIVTAVHSVFINISNMRETISSIQKHYVYENYGKPSENLLNAIKNISTFEKLDNRSNWKQLSKHLRNILNHFEDIKFYINLDKTARLPSDASLTTKILNEMKWLLSNIALTNLKELHVPAENELYLVIRTIDENLKKIENRSVLDVKEKIPIFKEISSQLLEFTEKLKQYYEINIDISADHNDIQGKTMFPKEDQNDLKIITTEKCEPENLVEVSTFQPNTVLSIKSNENSQNLSNELQTLNTEISCSNEEDTQDGKKLIIESVRPIIDSLIEEAMNKIIFLRIRNISEKVFDNEITKENNINQSSPQDFTYEQINDTLFRVPNTQSDEEIKGANYLEKLINQLDTEHLSDKQIFIDNLQSVSTPIKNLEINYEEQASPIKGIESIDTILKRDDNNSGLGKIEELVPDLYESENLSSSQLNHNKMSDDQIKNICSGDDVIEHQLEPDIFINENNINMVSTSDISTHKSEGKEDNQENLKMEHSDIVTKSLSQKDEPELNYEEQTSPKKGTESINTIIKKDRNNSELELGKIEELVPDLYESETPSNLQKNHDKISNDQIKNICSGDDVIEDQLEPDVFINENNVNMVSTSEVSTHKSEVKENNQENLKMENNATVTKSVSQKDEPEINYEDKASPTKEIEAIDTILKRDDNNSELELGKIEELVQDLYESETPSNSQQNLDKISDDQIKNICSGDDAIEHQLEPDVFINENNVNMVSTIDVSTHKSEVKENNQENLKMENSAIVTKSVSQKDEPELNYEEQASPTKEIETIDTILKRDDNNSELELGNIEELVPDLYESETPSNSQQNQDKICDDQIKNICSGDVVIEHQLEPDIFINENNLNMVSTSGVSTLKSEVTENKQENLNIENSAIVTKIVSKIDEHEMYCKFELENSKDAGQISKNFNDVNLETHNNEITDYNKDNLVDSEIITEDLSLEDVPDKDCNLELKSSEYFADTSNIIEQKINAQLTPDEIFHISEEFVKSTTLPVEGNQNDNKIKEKNKEESNSHYSHHENIEFTNKDNEIQSPSIEFTKNHEHTSSIVEVLPEKEVKAMKSILSENSSKSHKHSENESYNIEDIQPHSNKNMNTTKTDICLVEEADLSYTLVDNHIKNIENLVKESENSEKEDTENSVFKNNFKEIIVDLKSENGTQEIKTSVSDKDGVVTAEKNQIDDEKIYDKDVLKDSKLKINQLYEESNLINDKLQCEKLYIIDIQQPQVQVGVYSKENYSNQGNNSQSKLIKSKEDEIKNREGSITNAQSSSNGVKSLHITQFSDVDSNVVNINQELLSNTDDYSKVILENQESVINRVINESLSETEVNVIYDQENVNKIFHSSENQKSVNEISSYAIENISQNINKNCLYPDSVIENKEKLTVQNNLHIKNYIEQDKLQNQLFKLLEDSSSHEETSKNDENLKKSNDQQFNVLENNNIENKNENKPQKSILDSQFLDNEENNIDNDDVSTLKSKYLQKNAEISSERKLTKETSDNLKKELNNLQDDLSSRNDNEKETKQCFQGSLDVKEVTNILKYGDLQEQEIPKNVESEIHHDSVPDQIKLKNNYEDGFSNKIKETQEVKCGENDNKEKISSFAEINESESETKTNTYNYHIVTENLNENEIKENKRDITSDKNEKAERNRKYHKSKPADTEKNKEYISSKDTEFYGVVKEPEKTIALENNKIPFNDIQNKFLKSSSDLANNQNTYIIKEKPQFIDPNVADSNMGFSRPPIYVPKSYDPDNLKAPEINIYNATSNVFYKANSLIREHQIRSQTDMSDVNIAEKNRQTDTKQKQKAMSETRSFYSDKQVSSMRDLKRKPVFSTHLTNRTAVEGSRVKLTCSVLSSTSPILKWFKNGILLENKQKYKIKFVDGLITMELLNALPSDSGDYSCTVENEHGFVTTSAKLKVYPSFEASPIPPTFTRSIRDIYHRAENELVLECRIRGQPLPTITWLKDNMPISSEDRYEALYLADGLCRLTINSPTIEDSGSYTCRAESSMWSDQITHIVNFTGLENRIGPHLSSVERLRNLHDTRRPHFTNVLSDYKVVKGGTIGLQVEIGGAPTRVEWLRGGSSVTDIDKNAQVLVDHGIYTLALSDVTEKHSGLYTCRAWSTHGNVDMNADITVVQPNEMEGKPPVIVSRPAKDILISVGEDINISFRVHGEPRPKVFFMKGIRDITNSQRVCKMTSDDYVKFTLKRSVISDAGTYCILARNIYGCDRTFVTVVVRQRASSENLVSDWIYPIDDSTIFAADRNYKTVPGRIPGEPSAVDGGSNWVTLAWPKPDPYAVAPILAYRVDSWLLGKDGGARWIEMGITPRNNFDAFNLKQGEEYHFRVTPRNRYGWGEPVQTSSPIGVGIAGDRPEFIDILPGLLKVLVGETANLSCSFRGKPTPDIVWMKNGHEIEEISRIRSLQRGNVCSLTIKDVEIQDEGRYSCEATNVHGRASTYARMTVITDRQIWEADAKLKRERSADATGDYPPQFTMRLRDRRVQVTYPVRLTCQVIGSPAPSMTWFKDGQEIIYDSRKVQYKDEHFHTLEIAPTALDDGGVYEALARNNSGAVSCRCCLVVDKGIRAYVTPDFCCGLEPLYRLNEGEELRVSAIVEAYPSVGVTWYRDGVRLRPSRRAIMTLDRDGQIELALASVTTRDAGVYTCTASNEVGQASTSGKVEIVTETPREDRRTLPVVICPDVPYSKEPMFIKKPRSTEAQEGDTVIIECEVIGDPTPDVYWLRDFLKPDYYRDAIHFKQMAAGPLYRFEIPHAKLDFTGAYSVVARNVHGEAKAIISLQIFAKDLRSNDDTHNIRYGRVEVIPRFEKELTDLLCYDGDAIEFECQVSGNPEPDIRWFHYNEVLPDCPDFESTYEKGTARLKIKQVAAEDEGTYTCEASNNLGKATSRACLVVYPPGEPNTLSQRLQRPPALASAASTPRSTPRATPARSTSRTPAPRSGSVAHRLRSPTREIAPKFYTYPYNKVVEEGDSVVLQCAVGGLPTPWATWDKDGIIITPTSRISIKEKDEMLRILQIDEVTTDDVGLYRITLENDFGRAEASARVEVISHKGKFYARSSSASPGRVTYRRRTPSLTRQD